MHQGCRRWPSSTVHVHSCPDRPSVSVVAAPLEIQETFQFPRRVLKVLEGKSLALHEVMEGDTSTKPNVKVLAVAFLFLFPYSKFHEV